MRKQHTLNRSYKFEGKGLHTGVFVHMEIMPAPVDTGVVFHRTDLGEDAKIAAVADYVSDLRRNTTIEHKGIKISTVEHLLAALSALEVDNVIIALDGGEVPILDGSAKPYTDAISVDGLAEQEKDMEYFVVESKICVKDEKSGAEIIVYPDDEFSIDVMVDFNSKVVGHQYARYAENSDFIKEIAPSKTFVFFRELEQLLENGLIKGGDVDNALIIVDQEVSQEEMDRVSKLFGKRDIKRLSEGYLNNVELKYENECARHKLLDVMGDLSLVGFPIKGKVIATKPGHAINTKMAVELRSIAKRQRLKPAIVQYDANKEPVIDINGIKKLLPHRPPFLMVDRIIEMSRERVIGIKTIGVNEWYFGGHFPDEPVMPGVLMVEAMAQVGGILILNDLDEPERYSTYFVKIDNVKFKRKVVPGDVLVIDLVLTQPLHRTLVGMKGKVYVGDTLACEGDVMAQVVKNR